MACLISKRGKLYRKLRLDIWGYYSMYFYDRISEERAMDNTIRYWARIKRIKWIYKKYMRGKYVFRIWNRPRSLIMKKRRENYLRPRYLRNFYMVLKKKTYVKYVKLAMKGKLVRGFTSTYLGYLEARLFIIIYRLNIVNNIFMIKSLINLGIFYINFRKKKHINTKMQLGDFLDIEKNWKAVIKKDIALRLEYLVIAKNIKNFYANYIQLYFFLFKTYKINEINYPIRIDLYRAIDFIGPLR